MRGRFVQEKNRGILSKRLGQDDALALPPGQAFQRPVGEVPDIGLAHGLAHPGPVSGPASAPRREIRGPSHQHDLQGRIGEGRSQVLGHHGDEARRLSSGESIGVGPTDLNGSPGWSEPPRAHADQRGLAGAVRADQPHHLPPADRERHVLQDGGGSVTGEHPGHRQARLRGGHRRPFSDDAADRGRTGLPGSQ